MDEPHDNVRIGGCGICSGEGVALLGQRQEE